MGRKNTNARRRYNGASYNSFAELKNAGTRFDLSESDFIQKTKNRNRASKETEIVISIASEKQAKYEVLSCSVRADKGRKLGQYLKAGIVSLGVNERLYFVATEESLGFKLSQNNLQNNTSRFYVRFPLNDKIKPNYLKYLGAHELKYDSENAAYYVTP